jgi:hypothetical protein
MTDHHEPPDIADWMQKLAALPLEEPARRRSAAHIWWKAELLRRQDLERRVTAPLETAEPIIVGLAVFAAVVLFRWAWDALSSPGAHPVTGGLSLSLVSLAATAGILAIASYIVVRNLFQPEA